MDDRLYVECLCGSPDHLVSFYRDDEDVGINVQMNPYLPIWRRVLVAFQYVFGHASRCHWSDALLSAEDRARVAEFVGAALSEQETGK